MAPKGRARQPWTWEKRIALEVALRTGPFAPLRRGGRGPEALVLRRKKQKRHRGSRAEFGGPWGPPGVGTKKGDPPNLPQWVV